MVMTVLEARVAPHRAAILQQAFENRRQMLPPQMEQVYLVQSMSDPELWRIVALWRSEAELEQYRQGVETPGGILMFREAGVEPTLSVFKVAAHATP